MQKAVRELFFTLLMEIRMKNFQLTFTTTATTFIISASTFSTTASKKGSKGQSLHCSHFSFTTFRSTRGTTRRPSSECFNGVIIKGELDFDGS